MFDLIGGLGTTKSYEIVGPAAATGGLRRDAQGFLAAVSHLSVTDEKLQVPNAVSSTRR